jgi:Tannase and feruloyl esterase
MNTHLLFALSAGSLLAACGSDTATQTSPVSPSTPQLTAATPSKISFCNDLSTRFNFPNTTVNSAESVAAGVLSLGGQPIADHCLVKGEMHKRTGSDGKAFAIGFEMRMPTAWNGRFYYQANGGLDGAVVTALGATGGGPITGALSQGFAVISSDAGHTGAQTTSFGFEAQSRLDYGYQAVGKLTPMAKELIKTAYGRPADRSYIGGCSNGGRHTLVATSRYADQYDGFLAGAPGYNLPKAAIAQIWGAQQYNKLATPGATLPNGTGTVVDLNTAFTPAERNLVASKILAKCDALDGLVDGLVQDTVACQKAFSFANDVPTCSSARDGTCLSPAQKTVIAAAHSGATTSTGAAIYNQFWFEPGIGSANWATWKFFNSQALDPLAAGTVFRVPPGFIGAMTASIDELTSGITATNTTYTESGMSLMTPPNHCTRSWCKNHGLPRRCRPSLLSGRHRHLVR